MRNHCGTTWEPVGSPNPSRPERAWGWELVAGTTFEEGHLMSRRAIEHLIASGQIREDVSCLSKKSYSVGEAARIYHCRFCNRYHLTSQV